MRKLAFRKLCNLSKFTQSMSYPPGIPICLFDLKTHPITNGTLLGANLEKILKNEVNCYDSQISYLPAGSHVLLETSNGKTVPVETDRN